MDISKNTFASAKKQKLFTCTQYVIFFLYGEKTLVMTQTQQSTTSQQAVKILHFMKILQHLSNSFNTASHKMLLTWLYRYKEM